MMQPFLINCTSCLITVEKILYSVSQSLVITDFGWTWWVALQQRLATPSLDNLWFSRIGTMTSLYLTLFTVGISVLDLLLLPWGAGILKRFSAKHWFSKASFFYSWFSKCSNFSTRFVMVTETFVEMKNHICDIFAGVCQVVCHDGLHIFFSFLGVCQIVHIFFNASNGCHFTGMCQIVHIYCYWW